MKQLTQDEYYKLDSQFSVTPSPDECSVSGEDYFLRDLGLGDWVKVSDWCGKIDDIATSEDGAVMLKIVSFKGIWNHHPYEWLEYREGAIVHATDEQVYADYLRFLSYASENADSIAHLYDKE
jgi:hypothetical protein